MIKAITRALYTFIPLNPRSSKTEKPRFKYPPSDDGLSLTFGCKNTKLLDNTTLKRKKMIKSVTRTLYIDGKPIAEYTQDPMADSELAYIEHLSPSILVHLKRNAYTA